MIAYKFRVTIDYEEDVLREIEIRSDLSFFEFQRIIVSAFEFSGKQMSSFYMSNEEWDKGEEIVLFDMGFEETNDSPRVMETTQLSELINKEDQRMLFVYDFLKMWVFYIELIGENPPEKEISYPRIITSIGTPPDEEQKSLDFKMPVDIIEEDDIDPEIRDLLDDLNDVGTEYIDPDDLSSY